jgi:TP901 family phage tail tape measure protein
MASGSIKGITIEIEGKTSGLVKSLKDVNKSLANTQKALKTVNQALKLNPKDVQTLKTKQDLLNSAIEDTRKKLELEQQAATDAAEALEKGTITKDEYNTLQAEVAKTAAELNKLEQEAEETAKAVEKIGKGTTQLDALSSKLKEVGTKMQEVGDKISAVGEKMQKFGASYTATVTAPIIATGKAALNAFNEVDDALDETMKKTGATGQEAEELRGIVEKLATSTDLAGASFDEVADAVGEVQTKFGLTGDSLEKTSAQFVKFAKINNTDVTTSVDKVQKTLAVFGLKGEDANKIMDALTKTSQKYGNQVDKLADGLVQNGTAFQELGLTVEQSIDIMGRFEKSGANSETVMQGFRKALKNATKDGKPLNEALTELENTIKNGKDGVDGLTAAYDIFGKSGDQIYGAIKNGTLTFKDFNATVEDTAGTVDDTFNQITDDGDNMTVAMNSLKLALSKVGESITTTLAPILTKLAEKLQEVAKWWDELDPKTQDMIIKQQCLQRFSDRLYWLSEL